jgi:hypothetical protein
LASTTNGSHSVTLTVWDKAGNSDTSTYTMVYDDINPSISSFSAADNDSSNNSITPAAGFTNSQAIVYSSSTSDTNKYSYTILDGSTTIYGNTTTDPNGQGDSLANTTAGAHTLTLYVYDKAGNSNYATYSITYDETAPTISSFSAADADLSNNDIDPASGYTNSVGVSYSITESDTNLWKYQMLDGSTTINSLSTAKPTSGSISTSSGAHTLKIYVYDKAGNGSYKTYSITYLPDNGSATISFSAADGDLSNNAITPAAGYVDVGSSIIFGITTVFISYYSISYLKPKFGYDDALDAFGLHGMSGAWGAILTGVFASPAINGVAGLLYGNPTQVVIQIISIVAVAVYSFILTYVIAIVLDKTVGLRVDEKTEIDGLDMTEHEELGYRI